MVRGVGRMRRQVEMLYKTRIDLLIIMGTSGHGSRLEKWFHFGILNTAKDAVL